MDVITYPCWDQSQTMLVKGATDWWTVHALKRMLCWCLFPDLWSNEVNNYKSDTQMNIKPVR